MRIDSREDDTYKNHDWGFPTKVEQLSVGDYIIENSVVIEHKEINDFVNSLDQRMWQQAHDIEKVVEEDGNGIVAGLVIIQGTKGNLDVRNVNKRNIEGIYGAKARLILSYGLSVDHVRGESQFFKQMKRLHAKADTDTTKQKPHLTKRRHRDDRINILYGIEGIGQSTAEDILERFDTVADVANASTQHLKEVDGIGPKTAQKIHDAFHEGA